MGLVVRRHDSSRVAPVEFRDEAELFARNFGGHGDVVWVGAPINAWQVRLSLNAGDPRLQNPDSGTHFEAVTLHEWVDPRREPTHPKLDLLPRHSTTNEVVQGYVPLDLDEIGVSGMREILEKGSLLTGRGDYDSADRAIKAVSDRHRKLREQTKLDRQDLVRQRFKDERRRVLGIPQIPVGIDLTQ